MMDIDGRSRGMMMRSARSRSARPRMGRMGMAVIAAVLAFAMLLGVAAFGAPAANAASDAWTGLSLTQKRSSYGYFVWKSQNAATQAEKDAAAKAAGVLRGVYSDDLTGWGDVTNRNAIIGYTKIGEDGDATSLANMRQAIVDVQQTNDFRSALAGEPCRTDMKPTFDVCGADTNRSLTPYQVTDVMMAMAQLNANWMAAQPTYETLHARVFAVAENGAWPGAATGTAAAQYWYAEKADFDKGVHDSHIGHYANLTNKGWGANASDVKLTEYTLSGIGVVTRSTPGALGASWGPLVTQDYSAASEWDPQVGPSSSVDAYLADFDRYVALTEAKSDGCTTPFWDVTDQTSHKDDITWLACEKITTGYEDGTFGGMRTVVRGDMAAFLYRLAGSPTYEPSAQDRARFTDVNEGVSHAREIWWLASRDIAQGYSNGDGTYSFGPMRTVVRQDMAAFLKRFADMRGVDPTLGAGRSFTDVDSSTSHHEEIEWLLRTGVTGGYPNGDGSYSFGGMRDVVRQDMAAFLHRMSTNVLGK